MDIAEIRKKAKSQAPPAGRDASVLPRVSGAAHESSEEPFESSGFVITDEPPAPVAEKPPVAHADTDGLDRLFAATEEFELATDESYADMLDPQADARAKSNRQYLAFHLGDEEYALDIARISEIIKIREFTDIPRAPDFVLGIISLRGVVVPVFDLRRRLNLGVAELQAATRIVVCKLDDVTVGLLVDSIDQVVNLCDDEIEPPPGVLVGLDREMISGVGRYQGRMIILLNLHSALNVEMD